MLLSFSALQRAENSSIQPASRAASPAQQVSVLFSEPKIPQFRHIVQSQASYRRKFQCSSASRKFLNLREDRYGQNQHEFQCSSASRKFLNPAPPPRLAARPAGFSALQRAENSSIQAELIRQYPALRESFSALQRAENSSMIRCRC